MIWFVQAMLSKFKFNTQVSWQRFHLILWHAFDTWYTFSCVGCSCCNTHKVILNWRDVPISDKCFTISATISSKAPQLSMTPPLLGLEKTLAVFLQFIIHTVFRETTLKYILYLLYLQRYFLSPARSTCTSHGAAIPPLLQWLFQPKGHRFFVSGKWSCSGRPGMWASICSQGKLCTHKVLFLFFSELNTGPGCSKQD